MTHLPLTSSISIEVQMHVDELAHVDSDIAERFKGRSWISGIPTQMQLIKELRLLREAMAGRKA
jgi:hypothetical protein